MNLPADRDHLSRAQAAALYVELEGRAATVRPATRSARHGRRRWAVLAPAIASLAVAAALLARPLIAGGPAAPGPDLAALGLPRLPDQQVQSVTRHGATSTVTYRSGLIEVVGPAGGGSKNGIMISPGEGGLAVEVGGRRVLLSGLEPALLHRLASLLSRGGSSLSPSPTPSTLQPAP